MPRVTVGLTCWKVFDSSLGSSFGGGTMICRSGGVAWIVAPSSTAVKRTWYCRNDAVTTAQSCSGCTGWFIPTSGQLSNPGYTCRTYWAPTYLFHPVGLTWSSTESNATEAQQLRFNPAFFAGYAVNKNYSYDVRAFRCVAY